MASASIRDRIFVAAIDTPLGVMRAFTSDAGLLQLDFHDRRDVDIASSRFAHAVEDDTHPHIQSIRRELSDYFAGNKLTFTTPIILPGSSFERQAWNYLLTIPPGETRTYGQQASALGDVGAARAVGRANGMNFLAIIVPCHRVIGASGKLTGYGGGLNRKAWLLEHERCVTAGLLTR
ncbi:MAG: methylated-DNA--[protein]-cysteine S-methyltransferase [Tepidisphaeraceae bacterium]